MKRLIKDTDANVKDYFNKVKDKYPDLTYEDFKKICKAPFTFFRKAIESGDFKTINIKKFGKFIPHRNFKEKRNDEATIAFEKQEQSKGH